MSLWPCVIVGVGGHVDNDTDDGGDDDDVVIGGCVDVVVGLLLLLVATSTTQVRCHHCHIGDAGGGCCHLALTIATLVLVALSSLCCPHHPCHVIVVVSHAGVGCGGVG